MTADHGPAVSGAHNTIVTTRAGKDLVSALCSGLLTIGPRFGGALDKAAEMFTQVQHSALFVVLEAVTAMPVLFGAGVEADAHSCNISGVAGRGRGRGRR